MSTVYEGEIAISNVAWDDRLSDPQSEMFKDLASKFEVGLDELFITSDLLDEAVFNIRVTSFNSGSVIVNFRLSWMPRFDPDYQVSREALMARFERELSYDDYRLAGIYALRKNSLVLRCKCTTKCSVWKGHLSPFLCSFGRQM